MIDFSSDFENKVYSQLVKWGFTSEDVLFLGVSGGADSISLLVSLSSCLKKIGYSNSLNVITVNHRIRVEEESLGDCKYVEELSAKLSDEKLSVKCKTISLEEKQVEKLSLERKRGTEEAARFLRYQAFENAVLDFCSENEIQNKKIFFALAHNENDQIETLIMRFLQGAGDSSRTGILDTRTVQLNEKKAMTYVRPLLNIQRSQIEKYLVEKNIHWRTDKTNCDNNYLRNKIRNQLIPLLNEISPGFENAVLSGREKAVSEVQALKKVMPDDIELKETDDGILINRLQFMNCDDYVKQRLLYDALFRLKVQERLPYSTLKLVMDGTEKVEKSGITFFFEGENLFIKKIEKKATTYGFFAIIEEDCTIECDSGTLLVKKSDEGFCDLKFVTKQNQVHSLSRVEIPFCFRSRQTADYVMTKEKGFKSVSDVLSDFKVDVEHKNLIPVIQSLKDGQIKVIWGSVFGFEDWIV